MPGLEQAPVKCDWLLLVDVVVIITVAHSETTCSLHFINCPCHCCDLLKLSLTCLVLVPPLPWKFTIWFREKEQRPKHSWVNFSSLSRSPKTLSSYCRRPVSDWKYSFAGKSKLKYLWLISVPTEAQCNQKNKIIIIIINK